MVLQSNYAKRTVSNVENTPPSVLPKSLASRLLSSTQRRRARGNGHSSKYAAEQAARRSRKQKQPTKQLKFKMITIPTPDVEMADVAPVASSSNTVPVSLPKELGRPDFLEVSREALVAADASFDEADPVYIREGLQNFGHSSLKSLACVRPESVPNTLPTEIDVKLQPLDGFSPINPTHMLAIFGPAPTSTRAPKRKVTLFPVHAAYLAAHCARLPPFAAGATESPAPGTSFKLPVRSICLPSPATYTRLSTFLYTKNEQTLFSGLLPAPPPSGLVSSPLAGTEPLPEAEHRKLVTSYAYQLASTYTVQVLLQHAIIVHGLWQNTCALGIFDDSLWEVIEVSWLVLLAAIAVGTGSSIDTVFGEEA